MTSPDGYPIFWINIERDEQNDLMPFTVVPSKGDTVVIDGKSYPVRRRLITPTLPEENGRSKVTLVLDTGPSTGFVSGIDDDDV